jgi:AcrR family transcriptional regulator
VKILEAALRVLAQRGMRRLSMAEVGDVAGVSRTTLYRYFPSKDELTAGIAAWEKQRFTEGLDKAVAEVGDVEARAIAAIAYVQQYNLDHPVRDVADSNFVLDYLRSQMPAVQGILRPHLHDALIGSAAVRAGVLTPDQALDIILRILATSWILPTGDGSHLVSAATWLAQPTSDKPPRPE